MCKVKVMVAKTVLSIVLWLVCLACGGMASAEARLTPPNVLRPLEAFQDCDVCPEMMVLPMGTFVMGGPSGESRLTVHWDAGNIRPVTPEDPYIAEQEAAAFRYNRPADCDGAL